VVDQQSITKTQLIDALRANEQEVVAALRALRPAEFEQGRYENGWTGRQILAHVAAIEWTYPRLLDIARQTPPSGTDAAQTTGNLPTRTAQGGIDAYNQRQVEKRVAATIDELIAEFQQNRAATIAAVEAVDEALLATPIRSAGGVTGPVGYVLSTVAVGHVGGHVRDITGGR
jgi:uncharacterized damage-inducible protein DinB